MLGVGTLIVVLAVMSGYRAEIMGVLVKGSAVISWCAPARKAFPTSTA